MALTQRLEFRQSQALVMTPQLMQAIKLLQYSNLELNAYVEGELERNPLLERVDDAPDVPGEAPEQPQETAASGETDWAGDELETSRTAMEERLGTDLDNVFPDDREAASATPAAVEDRRAISDWVNGGTAARDDDYNLEAFVSAAETLRDHLAEQLALAVDDPVRRLIGRYLIDMIDDAGYLQGDIADVAEKLGAPVADVEAVLATIHTFDPSGVGARNLRECLAIQLRERNHYDPAIAALLDNLELLARRDMVALKRACGVGDEDLVDMIAEIRALNPKPGLRFDSAPVQPVQPDVTVRSGADGGWIVELNTETLPRVLVNQSYYATLSKGVKKDTDKTYFSDCMQSATWLVRALDQRARTILKVATEIVRQQDQFFSQGVQFLRPLNLRTVADAIGMHESTVSRVTASKYIGTPRGIFEMKYFFTAAIASSEGGDAHSAESVRYRIRQMIDAEAPDAILSDDTIVDRLREAGVDIARRTVAKYRDALRIPSSVQRRREKQAQALHGQAAS